MSKAQEDALRYLFNDAARRPTPSPRPTASLSNNTPATGFGIKLPEAGIGVSEEEKPEGSGFLNNPLIKGIIDGLSVGGYATANIADNVMDSMEQGKGIQSYLTAPVVGISEGIQGAFGNEEKTTTYSDVIKRGQGMAGIDTESGGAKVAQGVGGFAGDVLLDPLTYLSFGIGKAGVSAIRAAQKTGAEGSYSREFLTFMKDRESSIRLSTGESLKFDRLRPSAASAKRAKLEETYKAETGLMPRHTANNRREAAGVGFSQGISAHRIAERERKLTKQFNRNIAPANVAFNALKQNAETLSAGEVKKQSRDIALMFQKASGEKLTSKELFINAVEIEHMATGRRGSVSTPKDSAQLAPTVALPTVAKAAEPPAGAAGRESPTDLQASAAEQADAIAIINSDPILTKETLYREAKKTDAVRIAETVANLRVGGKGLDGESYATYSKSTIGKLDELRASSQKVGEGKRDQRILLEGLLKDTRPDSLYNRANAELVNHGSLTKELGAQIITTLRAMSREKGALGDSARYALKRWSGAEATKSSRFNIDREKLDELGIHDSDIDLVLSGGVLREFGGTETGSLQALAKEFRMLSGIRGGSKKGFDPDHPLWDAHEELSGILGTKTIAETAKAIENLNKFPEFKYAQEFVSAGDMARVKGAYYGLSGKDGENLSLINVTDENIRQTIDGERIVSEQLMADLPEEIFTKMVPDIENIFEEFLTKQTKAVGTKTTKRTKASTKGEGTAAKIREDINDHALMEPYKKIFHMAQFGNNIKKNFGIDDASLELKDQILMAGVKYFDTKMLENGLDFQLTHLAPILRRGDEKASFAKETTVRVNMSDMLDAMGKNARINFIFGREMQLLPTQVLDLADILVRGATRLTPEGNIDKAFVRSQANLALKGAFGSGRLFDRKTNLEVQADPVKGMPVGAAIWNREIKHNLDEFTKRHNLITALKKLKVDDDVINAIKTTRNEAGKVDGDELLILAKTMLGDTDILPSALDKVLMEDIPASFSKLIESMLVVGADDVSGLSKLIRANMTNTALVAKKVSDRAADNAIDSMRTISVALKNGSTGDAIEAIKARKAGINLADLPEDAKIAMAKTMDTELMKVVEPDALNHIDNMSKSGSPVERNARVFDKSAKQADELIEDALQAGKISDPEEAISDLNVLTETLEASSIEASNSFMAVALGSLGNAFSPRYGKHMTYNVLKESDHAFTRVMSGFHAVLNELSSPRRLREGKVQVTNEKLVGIMKNIQRTVQQGGKMVPGSVEEEIHQIVSKMFDSSNWSYFDRINMNPKYIELYNRNLANAFDGKVDHLTVKKIATGKKTSDGKKIYRYPDVDEISKMWESWDFKNPFAFLSKMLHTQAKTAQDVGMASAYSKNFGSKTQEPGTFKIPDDFVAKYKFAGLVDTSLFYPKEVIRDIPSWNRTFGESADFANKHVDNIVKNYADPVISALKFGQTSLKPGHHVMSITGDLFRNSLATNSPMVREYGEMAGVLTAYIRRDGGAAAVDGFTRSLGNLQGVKIADGFKDGKTIQLNLRGKPAEIDMDEIMELMDFHGISMTKHTGGIQEDFLTGDFVRSNTKVKNAVEKLTTNRAVGWINNVSAMRDTYSRGALFLKFMRSKRFNSVEEAARFAAMEVKKWAPVGQDLANWESKVARRVFFYYTWIRGMTPRVLESLLTRPGMSTIASKGMYNIAVANGLDPTSFGDPFDPELKDMLPSYLRERVIGPSFKSEDDERMGINPVHPTMDILNSWGSGITPADMGNGGWAKKIGDTLVGMSTPWIRAPEELRRMETLDSGIPIDSRFQYLQDLVGPARTLSRITGKTAQPYINEEGTVDFLSRTETKYRNGEEGLLTSDSTDAAGQDAFNWLTGSQLTNYDAPNLAKSAEFEQMDKEKAAKLAEERRQ